MNGILERRAGLIVVGIAAVVITFVTGSSIADAMTAFDAAGTASLIEAGRGFP